MQVSYLINYHGYNNVTMKDLIIRFLYRLVCYVKTMIGKINEKEKLSHISSSIYSKIYPEADIFNFQDPAKIRIGPYTNIRGELCVYPYGEGIEIGEGCYVGKNSVIRAANSIRIGNHVLIAHNVTIIDTDSHEIDSRERALSYIKMLSEGHPKEPGNVLNAPIIIKDYAWISFNVSILKGVTIGEGAIIGAGSVVTHDVPDYCLACGNPAKVIKCLKCN